MIENKNDAFSTRKQCRLLEVNRATHYYVSQGANQSDALLMNEIKEIWLRRCFYGYRRITKELQAIGHDVNRKRVLRLMQNMGLNALYPKTKTSLKNQEHKIHPYALKDLAIEHSNQAWQIDITYCITKVGLCTWLR